MPQLIIEQPGTDTMTVPLSRKTCHLGRADDNDVVLVADEISRHHAKVVPRGEDLVLIDLNSMNGTYVNRQRIVERVLSHLDEVWFGSKCRLVFRDDTTFGRTQLDRALNAAVPGDAPHPSAIAQDLNKIRAEIDRVASSLTLISKQADGTQIRGEVPSVVERGVPTPPPTSEDLVAVSRAYRRLSALYEASKLIASDFDLSKRLSDVLDKAIEVTGAERGFVLLRDDKTGGLRVTVAREMGQDLKASSPSMGIAGRAAIDGEPVLMADRDSDDQFGGRQSIIFQRIKGAMCVPLQVEDRLLGSIYVDTRKSGQTFTKEDLELFAALASQSAMAIENSQLYERMIETEKKRANLGRFLSPSIVDAVMNQKAELQLGGLKRHVATLFADIRGFTPLSERLEPDDLVDLLNEHFTAMTDIVFEFQGTLDKYNGDQLMALFGAPIGADAGPSEDARRAIWAALAMQAKCGEMNAARRQAQRPCMEIGIGIDTGEVIAGYIGSLKRLDFTVIGDHVNTASRFCAMASPGQIVVGESTYQAVKDLVKARALGTVLLRGKEAPVHAYEIEEFVDG